jgi:hypothetical protein
MMKLNRAATPGLQFRYGTAEAFAGEAMGWPHPGQLAAALEISRARSGHFISAMVNRQLRGGSEQLTSPCISKLDRTSRAVKANVVTVIHQSQQCVNNNLEVRPFEPWETRAGRL